MKLNVIYDHYIRVVCVILDTEGSSSMNLLPVPINYIILVFQHHASREMKMSKKNIFRADGL